MKAFGFLNDRLIFLVACIRATISVRHSQMVAGREMSHIADVNRAGQFSKLLQHKTK